MSLARSSAIALAIAGLSSSAGAMQLLAVGQLDSNAHDLSGLSAPLENGQPGDLLGGLGSGLAWAGGSTFVAVPDRGPNAVPWNEEVDDTTTYIPRIQTLTLELSDVPDGALPMTLTPTLTATTLLYSKRPLNYGPAVPAINRPGHNYFSGRSDNFDPARNSGDVHDGRLDPEGIRVSSTGRTAFISDEYGPDVWQVNLKTGERLREYKLPSAFYIQNKSAIGDDEIAGNTVGRVANKGMEGLAITPDGRTLVGFEQSPLIQDGGDGGRANRIVAIDLETGARHQYCYDNFLDDLGKAYNSSELLALNSHEFLVLERDGKGRGDGSSALVKRLYKIDIQGAVDVTKVTGEANLLPFAVPKTLFLDIRAALVAAGIPDTEIPAKLEGEAFGPDVVRDGQTLHTLYIGNDNDFLPVAPGGLANPNQWFVFGFGDDDLDGSKLKLQHFEK